MDFEVIPVSDDGRRLATVEETMLAQLSERSRRVYKSDLKAFVSWLVTSRGLVVQTPSDLASLSREDMAAFRMHLNGQYAKPTAARKLSVVRRFLKEAVASQVIATSPATDIRGFKAGPNETTHNALTKKEAQRLLAAIDQSTNLGKRDYAIIYLLIRTGIRRSECVGLSLGDIAIEQGHHVARIRHGKGDKPRVAKLPVEVVRAISTYLEAAQRKEGPKEAPLFVAFAQHSDRATNNRLTDRQVWYTLNKYAKPLGIEVTPHGLRATFVTLTLEGGAKLQQVQYAAGHADPRTTERYQKRKLNLDDNAVDYLRL